jgi:UDP-N-acetylmuramate: L-alanyl-gamma-D-glutamyl-meso-diaminopimelate ligase
LLNCDIVKWVMANCRNFLFASNLILKIDPVKLLTIHSFILAELMLTIQEFSNLAISMKVHFTAIGGSAMHNLALALHKNGFTVSGSDDEILEPSRTRLAKSNLLPETDGWFPEKITNDLDAVILGMHARADNPELLKAQQLGVKIFSYPEYIYEQSKDKTRVVIGGSHGKTTITAMILHVLKLCNKNFDYMVGAQLEGFDTMVKITKDAPVIILEGDEYLSSPIDRRPKFHLYHPHIALLSGIAWDHINVFPTLENYIEQFRIFIDLVEDGGSLIYCENDTEVKRLSETSKNPIQKISYGIPEYEIRNGITYLTQPGTKNQGHPLGQPGTELQIFGEHNLMNLNGARLVCNKIGVNDADFFKAISTFKGAAKRLELVDRNDSIAVYKDFAHSPSKLKATIHAVKQQFTGRKIIACMELHTFSSLNENFLIQYKDSMNDADEAIVYYNPHTIEHKKLKPISDGQVKDAFGKKDLKVFINSTEMKNHLLKTKKENSVLLMMSSGNFDGIDFKKLAAEMLA